MFSFSWYVVFSLVLLFEGFQCFDKLIFKSEIVLVTAEVDDAFNDAFDTMLLSHCTKDFLKIEFNTCFVVDGVFHGFSSLMMSRPMTKVLYLCLKDETQVTTHSMDRPVYSPRLPVQTGQLSWPVASSPVPLHASQGANSLWIIWSPSPMRTLVRMSNGWMPVLMRSKMFGQVGRVWVVILLQLQPPTVKGNGIRYHAQSSLTSPMSVHLDQSRSSKLRLLLLSHFQPRPRKRCVRL